MLFQMPDTVSIFMAQVLEAFLRKIGQTSIMFMGPTSEKGTEILTDIVINMLNELKTIKINTTIRVDQTNKESITDAVRGLKTQVKSKSNISISTSTIIMLYCYSIVNFFIF